LSVVGLHYSYRLKGAEVKVDVDAGGVHVRGGAGQAVRLFGNGMVLVITD
jgi:hypothetical protein